MTVQPRSVCSGSESSFRRKKIFMKTPKIMRALDRSLTVITAIAVVCMIVHVTAHALMRFFFDSPLPATNELIEFLYMPFIALVGIPAALLQREHIVATLVTEKMTTMNAIIFRVFGCILGVVISGLWAYYGLLEAMHKMEVGATAGITAITIWPIYFIVPLVFSLLSVLYVYNALKIIRVQDPDPMLITPHA